MTNRIAYIDGLRGTAALGVLAYHLSDWWGLPTYTKGPVRFAIAGQHGVELFFVLSGFCLSWSIFEKLRNADYAEFAPADYLARRLVRILPPFYMTILVLGAVELLDGKHIEAADIFRQALFLDKDVRFLEAPFWTLGIEFRWYFAFPLLVVLWLKAPRAYLLGVAAAIAVFECTVARSFDLGALPAFALGIVAADFEGRRTLLNRRSLLLLAFMLVFCILISEDYVFTNFAWSLGMFALVVAAGYTPWMRFLLSTPFMRSIGTISYSLYLMNLPIVNFVYPLFAPRLGLVGAGVAAAVAAVLGSACFFFAAERPFLKPWNGILVTKIASVLTAVLPYVQIPQRIVFRRFATMFDAPPTTAET